MGILPPSFWNFCGSLRNSTISDELVLGLLDPGDVGEGHLLAGGVEELRPALAERERLVAAGLHLAHEEDPEADDQQERRPAEEELQQRVLLGLFDVDPDLGGPQLGDQLRIVRHVGGELLILVVLAAFLEGAGHFLAADGHLGYPAIVHLFDELREDQLLVVAAAGLECVPENDHHHEDGDPENECANGGIQVSSLSLTLCLVDDQDGQSPVAPVYSNG